MNKQLEALIADLLRSAVKIGAEKWVSKNGEVTTEDYEVDGVTYTDHICNCEVVDGQSLRAEFIAKANPATVMALIAALEQAQQEAEHYRVSFSNERVRADKLKQQWDNRTPTEWAYNQACAALHKYKSRVEELEARKLAVKLPPRKTAADYVDGEYTNEDLAAIYNVTRLECSVRIKNAGGTVEGE